MALTIGEVKAILKDVPDDYEALIDLEDMGVENIEIDNKRKTVSFDY